MTEKTVAECQSEQFHLCPKFQKTFTILGKKWNGLIVDVLLEDGTQRFKDLAKKVPKCSDRVLVERLKELEQEKIVERKTYSDSALIEYQLTPQGQDLEQVITAVHSWSDTWLDAKQCVEELTH
ncbi:MULTISPECIES: winged helix-turn-helix transcriptional regulator [Loigolactobacillus]|uniref:HxlR family transcriptional regulator n=1 Tax=Loigolactobacillus backii TaxID=375175 RepID=A0A192H1P8_9LACO|nr:MULTISPECIES: helix-turn-helix domain-containing protein [Loigolactobacillus]ANK59321.1 HxlR family transcriptional regulator [Loigolactobacillus backii]ANK62734.1 HxlR family transcriptional regulator [Loigolactobacillus backii]ANK64313.1 HxlR family transcriptional regulator [Loigolactobacillus backii]ANK67292.1 HxlR family transcriptional regulator [Loigolactobacillus backii]ANK70258.1 HxlR family transcriptional regulator [Loigolactobacillus backii]